MIPGTSDQLEENGGASILVLFVFCLNTELVASRPRLEKSRAIRLLL